MSYMLYGIRNCTAINLAELNTGNVTTLNNFAHTYSKITELELSSMDTSKVVDFAAAFADNNLLANIDTSCLNFTSAVYVNGLFKNCAKITEIVLNNITDKMVLAANIVFGCEALQELDMSNCDLSGLTDDASSANMFYKCSSLEKFNPPANISASLDFSDTILNAASVNALLDNLNTVSSKTLTLNYDEYTEADPTKIAAAQAKGWTIA